MMKTLFAKPTEREYDGPERRHASTRREGDLVTLVQTMMKFRPVMVLIWLAVVFLATKLGAQMLWPEDRYATKAEVAELKGELRVLGRILCTWVVQPGQIDTGARYVASECARFDNPASGGRVP